ncbi:hypothetical protein AAFF_G00240320 [Aldrovandia affinis]|uniref:Cadherin domain-containing protein n=1 Tax=Aldrovandia affinis TaxID=143900 RepID=A0AAD7SWC3_9TELE|nr:hypothetical protein AAFF_G00240320 [Aldrovandia affinis]
MKFVTVILLVTLLLGILEASSQTKHIRKKRAWIIDSFSIEEEHPGPFPYEIGKVDVDRDDVGFALHGKGVDEEPKNMLTIHQEKGIIYVLGKIDYERYKILRLTFEAKNKSNMMVDTKLGVEITITDINDHAPEFQMKVYETTIEESLSQGQHVLVVFAHDDDQPNTPNSTFTYRIVSVTPKTPDVEFYIEQNGVISFKGCLDYEKAEKYSILVEAKDHGEVVKLASTCTVIVNIMDKNNHLPKIIGRTGTGKVMERDSGKTVLRLHVEDKDAKNTKAWRAKYTIYGDEDNHFKIETDPETNDGILIVQKPLDFEEGPQRNLSISVENQDPYFSCQVKRKTSTGLWTVTNIGGASGAGLIPQPMTQKVTIIVEDINDPPTFTHRIKEVMVSENVAVGHLLEQFTAVDLDLKYTNEFEYIKGDDPGDWVTVDSKTGQILTAKTLDRESPYVVNNTYTVTLMAIDKGKPPMSATATLTIHLKDENDNLPHLQMDTMDMCLSDEPTVGSITATDLDEAPYSGPFHFELLGDVKDKWLLDPAYGTTVNLVKSKTVFSGQHDLLVKISDTQGEFSVQNLTITVCECSVSYNCQIRSATSTQIGGSAIGIMIGALLLLMGILLLLLLISCGREKSAIQIDHGSGVYLIPSNIETPGTDCKVPAALLQVQNGDVVTSHITSTKTDTLQPIKMSQQSTLQSSFRGMSSFSQSGKGSYQFQRGNSLYRSLPIQSLSRSSRYQGSTFSRNYSTYRGDSLLMRHEAINTLLSKRIYSIQAPGEELSDYQPHCYAYEGDSMIDPYLDAISIPESEFSLDKLLDLGPRFNNLAAICRPAPTAP